MEAGVRLDEEFDGDMKFSCFVLKLKSGGISKLFGAWNRRFLFLNLEQKNLYYSSSPTSESQTLIKLSSVREIKILGNNIDEKTVLFSTVDKDYTFKFENLAEFRDFLIYFIFVKKAANGQKLFDPPECFLDLIRKSQQLSDQNRKLLKQGLPAQHLTDDVRPLDSPPAPQTSLASSQLSPEELERENERKRKQEIIKNCDTDDENELLEKKKKKKKHAEAPPQEAPPEPASQQTAAEHDRPQRHIVRRDIAEGPVQKLSLTKEAGGPSRPLKAAFAERTEDSNPPKEALKKSQEEQKPLGPAGLSLSQPEGGAPKPMKLSLSGAPSQLQPRTLKFSHPQKKEEEPKAGKEKESKPKSKFIDDTVDIEFTSSVVVPRDVEPQPGTQAALASDPHLAGSFPTASTLSTAGAKPRLLITPKVNFSTKPSADKPGPEPKLKLSDQKPKQKLQSKGEEDDWEIGNKGKPAPKAPPKANHDDFDLDD